MLKGVILELSEVENNRNLICAALTFARIAGKSWRARIMNFVHIVERLWSRGKQFDSKDTNTRC
jgi:hypothetical protein